MAQPLILLQNKNIMNDNILDLNPTEIDPLKCLWKKFPIKKLISYDKRIVEIFLFQRTDTGKEQSAIN